MKKSVINGNVPSSFRDPSGLLFFEDGSIYRQVNFAYKESYDYLIKSGLYKTLVNSKLLIPHEEVSSDYARTVDTYKILRPELIPFISYPYEWCFSQLKDAALATLKIQKIALDFGMILKDSSAYNIQFVKSRPVLIDTLSFERYREGEPWIAYKQFCQHFLAPLTLMRYRDTRLNQLFRIYIDGIPLDLASSLLPSSTRFRASTLLHIHFHSRSQVRYAAKSTIKQPQNKRVNIQSFKGLIDSLEASIRKLNWHPKGTEWADYYSDNNNYVSEAIAHKAQVVADFLDKIRPDTVWDLGANTGLFSRVASSKGARTVSFDIDPAAVEKNYVACVEKKEANILPLLLDLTNPSSGIGWENRERMSFLERGPVDAVLALALIHHLAISNNVPLNKIAGFFSKTCSWLVIEFVPKSDSQVQRLLSTREDIFPGYTQEGFEREFSKYFTIRNFERVLDSERMLYLMERR